MLPRREPTKMEQLIAAQAQLTQVMAQFMANNNGSTTIRLHKWTLWQGF
jgi:hypothetical protein